MENFVKDGTPSLKASTSCIHREVFLEVLHDFCITMAIEMNIGKNAACDRIRKIPGGCSRCGESIAYEFRDERKHYKICACKPTAFFCNACNSELVTSVTKREDGNSSVVKRLTCEACGKVLEETIS